MFIGHFAVGFASRRWAPRTPLVLLMLAPLLADVLWPVFILAGLETARIVPGPNPFLVLQLDDFPWSHSLLMDAVWAVLLGSLAARGPDGRRAGVVVAIGVLSHWVLDFVTHRPDMPLWPGSAEYGLMLWRSVAGTMIVEGAMFIVGVAVYVGATRARGTVGHVALWTFVALLVFGYVSQLAGAPPPPSLTAVGLMALAMTAISLAWMVWMDHAREPAAR